MTTCSGLRWLFVTLLTVIIAGEATAAAYTPTKNPSSVQISPSVLIMGEYDWVLSSGADGKPWSRCLDSVWRARKYSNGNRLNFVPTHHWLPRSDGLGVSAYCYMHSSGAGDKGTCMTWTTDKLKEFTTSMTYCLTEALKQGFTPYIRPHLDDGLNRGVWRNSLLFSPTIKYGDYTYADVMTTPLAEAMRDALAAAAKLGKLVTPPDRSRPVVYMALQGEMSATIMRYTSAWATLIPIVKSTIGSTYADVKVGIGLNFNALDAVETAPSSQTASGGLVGILLGSASTAASSSSAPTIDASGVNDMLSSKLDFLGISAYSPYSSASFGINEFQNAAFNVGDSLATLANGLKLYSLASSGKLELHYSEFGIGGGVNGNQQISSSADACAKQPWAGIIGAYSTSMDPWQRSYLSDFRSSFYSKAMDWLSAPGSGTYRIKEVFVWGMASWDVFGTYPDSTGYRGLSIVQRVAAHNTAIIAAQVCAYEDADACDAFVSANGACLNDQSGTACLYRPSNDPNIVTEAGPAQTGTSPGPSPAPSPSPAGQEQTAVTQPPASTGSSIDIVSGMAPNDVAAAASPAPIDIPSSNYTNIVFVSTQPQVPVTTTTKNNALSSHLVWNALLLIPLLCSGLLV